MSNIFPFFFQNGPLHGVFVNGISLRIVDEGHKLYEQALLAHAQLLTQALAGQVVVLGVGIDPAGTLLMEQVVKESLCRFICVHRGLQPAQPEPV